MESYCLIYDILKIPFVLIAHVRGSINDKNSSNYDGNN